MPSRREIPKVWPKEPHPLTAEEFVHCVHITTKTEIHSHVLPPPSAPDRTVVVEWDDEGFPLEERELSDAEFAQAKKDYRKALKQYREGNGTVNTPGKTEMSGEFKTDSGAWARGMSDGDGRWLWATVGV
jgi:hypothetical protein